MGLKLIKNIPSQFYLEKEKEEYQNFLIENYISIINVHYVESTVPNFKSALANYIPWLKENGIYLWEIRPQHYDEFVKHLQKNLQKNTIKGYNAQISNFYNWIVSRCEEEIINKFQTRPKNPVDTFNTPRHRYDEDELPKLPDNDVVNYYFQKEKQEFATALEKQNHRRIFVLARQIVAEQIMFKAGLRVEEVSNLDVGDIDLKNMILVVRDGKNSKDRIVDISSSLAPTLKWYLTQSHPFIKGNKLPDWSSPLLLSELKSKVSKQVIQRCNRTLQEKFNIPIDQRFSPHGLRRLFATNLYIQLINEKHPDPLTYIKNQLGHVFYSTTMRYCRIPKAIIARAKEEAYLTIVNKLGNAESSDINDN